MGRHHTDPVGRWFNKNADGATDAEKRFLAGCPIVRLPTDEAVAHGAAIYANLLLESESGEPPTITVRNVCSHNLGVVGVERETGRPRTHVMIPRNTKLPAMKRSRFVTNREGQLSVAVNVIEGGDASGDGATKIGKCVVRDLPPDLPAGTPVEVVFRYQEDGRLTVSAFLENGGEARSEMDRTSGLTADTLQEWNHRILFTGDGTGSLTLGDRDSNVDDPMDDEPPPLFPEDDDEPPPLPF